MLKNDIYKMLQELAMDVYTEVIARMHKYGYNERAHANTLVGSDLEKSVTTYVNDAGDGIVFEIADYYDFITGGWHHSGQFPNTKFLFLKNLRDWIVKKNIDLRYKHYGDNGKVYTRTMTVSSLAYLIYRAINRRGIKARPFINSGHDNDENPEKILPFLKKFWEEFADDVFIKITEEIDTKFD